MSELSNEEKNSMELDIEAKYKTEKEFLNNITYAECLYILDTKNKYCDNIKNLSLLKIVDIVNKQSKEIEELKLKNEALGEIILYNQTNSVSKEKIKAKIEELEVMSISEDIYYNDVLKLFQELLEEEGE